ncbi:MAG: hypothetical protein M3N47_13805 [Chloroflexota bacterium]|nr:hypothetical protein [Chloroflexota bacterium]
MVQSKRRAKLRFEVVRGRKQRVVARSAIVTVKPSKKPRTIRIRLSRAVREPGLPLRVTSIVGRRRGRSLIPLVVVADPAPPAGGLPGPPAAKFPPPPGSVTGSGLPPADACPTSSFPTDLNAILNALPSDSDPDGDGFSTSQELNRFAFDPRADPTRFNPLIADVPRVDIGLAGLSIALFDTLEQTNTTSLGRVRVTEAETFDVTTDRQTTSTTESHTVGAEVSGGVGKGDGAAEKPAPKYGVEGRVNYQYTNATTKERTKETSSGTRNLNRSEVSELQERSETRSIESATLAVTAKIRNTGHVGFKVADIAIVLDSRLTDGSLSTFGGFQPDLDKPVSVPPGEERTVTFNLGGIGATDGLALAQDLSSLVMSVGSLRLSEIGRDGFQADTGDFAQYRDRIEANTAAVSLDLGAGRPSETHLVSTSFRRDADGRPAGIWLCDALRTVLGYELRLTSPRTINFGGGRSGVIPVLEALTPFGAAPVEAGPQQYFITNVSPAATGGRSVYGIPDVLLRGRQAAQIVLYRDADGDTLEARRERVLRSDDAREDSDGDGITDPLEANVPHSITTQQLGDPAALGGAIRSLTYRRLSSPAEADTDGDGASDQLEQTRRTDPDKPDTDGDGAIDQGPGNPGSGDQQPLAIGAMRDYRFNQSSPFGFYADTQSGTDRLRSGPPDGACPTERHQKIADRSGNQSSAVQTSGLVKPDPGESAACLLLTGEPLNDTAQTGGLTTGAMTVAAWLKLDAPRANRGSPPLSRDQWIAGQPGFFAFELQERGAITQQCVVSTKPDCEQELEPAQFRARVGSTRCGLDSPCPDPPSFSVETGYSSYSTSLPGYNTDAPGWYPFAMTARPARQDGKDGTLLRIVLPTKAETFVEGLKLDGATPCRLLLGARTIDCNAEHRYDVKDTAALGMSIDNLRIFRYAMTSEQVQDLFENERAVSRHVKRRSKTSSKTRRSSARR